MLLCVALMAVRRFPGERHLERWRLARSASSRCRRIVARITVSPAAPRMLWRGSLLLGCGSGGGDLRSRRCEPRPVPPFGGKQVDTIGGDMVGTTRLALACALLALLVPATAEAHGGSVVAAGGNDAYRLTIEAEDTKAQDGSPVVDLTSYPIRRSSGAPDLRANLVIRIDGGKPFTPSVVDHGLEALVPVKQAGAWRTWQVSAELKGAAGSLRISGKPLESSASGPSGPSTVLLAGSMVLLVALGGAAVVVRRRRRSASDPGESVGSLSA